MNPTDAFLDWAERDREWSPHTIARYRAVLSQLDDPMNATIDDIEAWWATRYDAASATRQNDLAVLRSFYRWATRFDHRPDDPTRRLTPPKIPNRVPRPIGESDLNRLMGPLTAEHPELRRAFALGAYGGLRVAEAAALDWRAIDRESRRIYVRGKGKKERAAPLTATLLDKLLPETGGNVVTAGGEPITAATLQRRVNRFMVRAGIDHTFHDLRKRGASLAMERVGNPVAVAQAFGWASVQTATHYASVSDETLDLIGQAMI